MGIRTGLWTIDPPTDFEPVARAAPHYDTIVCGGTEAMEILASRGIDLAHWLPFACAPRHHRPLELSAEARNRFGSEVAFVGSHYPNRARILERLADLDLGIWGPGWHRLPDAHPLRARIRGEHVGPEDWVRIYAASEIVVIVHYQDGTTPCHQASPKVYETLACGALALVDDQRDVFDLFRDGEHLVRFSDEDDLVVKVRRYLSAPGERRRIAEAGRREVLARHTYRHRVEHLTALVRGDAFPRSCPSRAADP